MPDGRIEYRYQIEHNLTLRLNRRFPRKLEAFFHSSRLNVTNTRSQQRNLCFTVSRTLLGHASNAGQRILGRPVVAIYRTALDLPFQLSSWEGGVSNGDTRPRCRFPDDTDILGSP